jgi:hypothetical protein
MYNLEDNIKSKIWPLVHRGKSVVTDSPRWTLFLWWTPSSRADVHRHLVKRRGHAAFAEEDFDKAVNLNTEALFLEPANALLFITYAVARKLENYTGNLIRGGSFWFGLRWSVELCCVTRRCASWCASPFTCRNVWIENTKSWSIGLGFMESSHCIRASPRLLCKRGTASGGYRDHYSLGGPWADKSPSLAQLSCHCNAVTSFF